LRAETLRLVPNGVDTHVFSPSTDVDREKVLGRRISGPVVGCVARFDPIKNHALLLDAFALVRKSHPNAVLVLVGTGAEQPSLERRAQQPDLLGSVIFTGDRRDTANLYRSFDVFALTSNAEGTSMSILEAMASGCCVVATNVGGNGALLDGGGAGILVPPGETPALSGQLAAALGDADARRRLGAVARSRAVSAYSLRSMALRYLEIYRNVLTAASGARRVLAAAPMR
jgi:glycosyltransferase involved in cell wall biosynthesis